MKVTIDIPDTTMAVFVSMIWEDGRAYNMSTSSLDTDDLRSGKAIKLPRENEDDKQRSNRHY